ncbi:AbrB/MazE/SpoVT family DNA-binding domain-containing protein [archaeon]|nr:AbrB/MazE/SpoVT family DNA-binding domain-containing protein [archaeon]
MKQKKSERFLMSKKSQGDFLGCPICEKGNLKKGKIKEYMFGIYLGEFSADICSRCGESFTDSNVTKKIEEIAKQKGIWGLSSITKITKTGNSLAVRIPKKIADYLNLKNGKEVYVHPEDNKLVIEAKL